MTNEELRRINEKYGIKNTQPQNIVSAAPSYYADHIAEKVSAINAKYGVPDTNIREVLKESYKRKPYSESSLNLPASGDYMGKPYANAVNKLPFSYTQALKEYKERKANAPKQPLAPMQNSIFDDTPEVFDSGRFDVMPNSFNEPSRPIQSQIWQNKPGFSGSTYAKGILEKGVSSIARGVSSTGAFLEGLIAKPISNTMAAGPSWDVEPEGEDINNSKFDIDPNTIGKERKQNRNTEGSELYKKLYFYNLNEQTKKEEEAIYKKYAENFSKASPALQKAEGWGVSAINAVPMALSALITNGASVVAQEGGLLTTSVVESSPTLATYAHTAVKNLFNDPNYWTAFFTTVGRSYEDGIEIGMSETGATTYALANSLLNAAIETGGETGAGGIQTLPQKGFSLKNWLLSTRDEAHEEVFQGIVERGLKALMLKDGNILPLNPDGSTPRNWEELKQAFKNDRDAVFNPLTSIDEYAGGFVVGGALGGGQVGINSMVNAKLSASKTVNEDSINAVASSEDYIFINENAFKKSSIGLIEQVSTFFESIGNKAVNPELGDVFLTKRSVKDDISHGIGRLKAASFAALPEAIAKGKVVARDTSYEGKKQPSYIIAAPISLNDKHGFMGIVVLEEKAAKKRLYVHEIILKRDDGTMFKTRPENSYPGDVPPSNIYNILNKLKSVNKNHTINELPRNKNKAPAPLLEPAHTDNLSDGYSSVGVLTNAPADKVSQNGKNNNIKNGTILYADKKRSQLLSGFEEAQKLNLSDNSYGRSFDELYNDVTNKTPAKTPIGSDPSTWPKLTYEEARLKTAEELIAERRKKEANRSGIATEKQLKTDGISLVKQSRQDFKRELNELFTIPQHLRGKANREIDRFINKMIAAGAATETDRQEMLAMLYDSGAFLKSSDNDYKAFEDSFDLVLGKFASKARLEMELRRAASKELLTEREKWKNSAKRRRERQELSKRNKQTQRDIKMLRKRIGQNDTTLAAAMEKLSPEDRKIAENAIRNISVDAFSLTERAKAKMIENKELYKQQLALDPNYIPSKLTLDTLEKMDQQYLADKTIADLSDIHRAITTLRTHIDNMNHEIGEARYREISDIYSKVKNEIESTKGRGKDVSAMSKFFNEEQLTPMNFLEMLSGWDKDSVWFDTVARQLEEGERKMKQVKVDAARILKDFKEKHSKWIEKSDGQGKNGIWYEIEVPELLEYGKGHKPLFGETTKVYLTPAMRVELSRGIRNNDNLRHAEGGVTFPDKELYSKGKRQEAYTKGTTIKLAPETMKVLFAYKNLTPEEQALYDVMDRFFDDYAKSRINETSQIVDGIDRAMSRSYSRIYTDENYRNNKMTIDQSIGGMGSLQGRTYSKVPMYAMSVWEAFDDTVDTVSKYYGMHIPVKNVSNLMNFIEQENKNSMRNVIARKWGPSSKKYIDSLITELSNKHYEEKSVAQLFFDKTLGNYVGATFAFNPGIVLKQAASYPAAAAVLGWGNVPSPMQIKNVDPELILKYTPELEYRSLGYATPEIAELKNNPNILQKNKVTRFFDGGAILAMDRFTVKSIWPWAENYVKAEYKTLKPGTDEFYKKTAEVFNDTVGLTQPMYDVMHRAKIMRGQNAALRALTMFKTVPVQQANMMRQAIGEYARAKTRTKKQKAWKKVIATTTSIVVATVLLESIEFGNNLFKNAAKKYRDDDDKLTAESISAEVGKKIAKDLVGNVIGGDEVVVLMERVSGNNYYNGIETPGLSQALDMGESVMKSLKLTMDTIRDINELSDNGGDTKQYFKEHGKDLLGSVKNLASDISTYSFGIPVSNIEKYLLGAMYWTDPKLKEKYLTLWENTHKRDLSGLRGSALKVRVGEYIDLRADGITDNSKSELARLYESQGVEVVPSDVPAKLTVNGKEIELTKTMEQKYRNTYAYIVNSCLNDLLSHKDYLALNDQDKATAITVLYSYAKAAAENASVGKPITKNLKSFKSVKDSGVNPVDYVLFMTKTKNITGDKGMRVNHTRKDKIMWIIDDMELSDDQKDALYLASGYVESKLNEAPWRKARSLPRFDIPKFELPEIMPPSFDYPKY